ncbi:unnamed protein product [Clonostachys chloroleuca]|uniref:Zn(2)-C6 fungal-type domain-containing protein n=1 Tax=Clonostachys chloroleuca TaxID=1926264 RepID=A0AA35M4P3_9HYPO|nr:unnamed protein product [Clonostachys chloroleuca]
MPRSQHSRRASRPSQPETSPGDVASSTGRAAGSSSLGRVTKRSTNACSRCRRQKIRCSGLIPCDACTKRKLPCEINDSEQKILVTRGYIDELQARIAALEGSKPAAASDILDFGSDVEAETQSPPPSRKQRRRSSPSSAHRAASEGIESSSQQDSLGGNPLRNPLSSGQSTFSISADGKAFYLGTSSNWSFARRILSMIHEFILKSPLPTADLLFDGQAYDLGWEGSARMTPYDSPAMPALDYAIYLINAVKFHCTQVFHLFDEKSFMSSLYEFYRNQQAEHVKRSLWYVHFLLILAFGKAFVTKRNLARRPPGAGYFVKAYELLPDVITLWKDPIVSCEILCCVALYLQSLDNRLAAHNIIGQAMRIALGQGMHTNMPGGLLGEDVVERSRRVWWTIYVLDREMTSLLGLPQSINDRDIYPELPKFEESHHRRAALEMEIRLSRVIATINKEIYQPDGKLNSRFLTSTKHVLEDVAAVSEQLQQSFPLQLDNSVAGVSRTAANLHLLYYQCIVLATRPLIFCFLQFRLESAELCARKLSSSQTVRNLVQMCIDSSLQMVIILESLQSQGLLESFLPFDIQSLFISTVNLSVAPAIDSHLVENYRFWLHKAFFILDEMTDSGSHIASKHKAELTRIIELLETLPGDHNLQQATIDFTGEEMESGNVSAAFAQPEDALHGCINVMQALPTPISGTGMMDDEGMGHLLATSQIMDMANSVDCGDTDWMSEAIMTHGIWQG